MCHPILTLVAASTLAPRRSSSVTMFTWPSLEARWRAFSPFWNTSPSHEGYHPCYNPSSHEGYHPCYNPFIYFNIVPSSELTIKPEATSRAFSPPYSLHNITILEHQCKYVTYMYCKHNRWVGSYLAFSLFWSEAEYMTCSKSVVPLQNKHTHTKTPHTKTITTTTATKHFHTSKLTSGTTSVCSKPLFLQDPINENILNSCNAGYQYYLLIKHSPKSSSAFFLQAPGIVSHSLIQSSYLYKL